MYTWYPLCREDLSNLPVSPAKLQFTFNSSLLAEYAFPQYKITKTVVKITVAFESKQVIALMDKNDVLIDGNMEKDIIVKDEWVFERKINYKNPNWSLVQTKSL